MIDFSKISNIWFIGIGGIGMSALARYFTEGGFAVSGYDRTESLITRSLISEGIAVIYNDDTAQIPDKYLRKSNTLVVYTPAIPETNNIFSYFRDNHFQIAKRSEILGIISQNSRTYAIAGTHGKTSVSTITAHLLKQSEVDCSAFLGGISRNYQTNLLTGKGNIVVLEADEFDRSFHTLSPEMAVITSMDADHLDIYGNYENMVEAFNIFVSNIKEGGTLLVNEKVADRIIIPHSIKSYTYGFNPRSDYFASDIELSEGKYNYKICHPDGKIENVKMLLPGRMNIENSIAAAALALLTGVDAQNIRKALLYYKGVARRFDVRINTQDTVYIDDYAHHPAEIEYCLKSVRELYGSKKVTGIFQPHLYSRTKDHADDFARVLDEFDRVILLPVYPAREKPIKGVSSEMIFERMSNENKMLVEKEDLIKVLGDEEFQVLLTLGAGDIDSLVGPVEEMIKEVTL